MNEIIFTKYAEEEEEDIVIEGSDLHRALIDAGLTDYTCSSVKKTKFIDVEEIKNSSKFSISKYNYKWFLNYLAKITDISWFRQTKKLQQPEIKQINIILQLELLLSDHEQEINSFYNQIVSLSSYNKVMLKWSSFFIFSSIAVTSFILNPLRIPSFVIISSSMLAVACYNYLESCSTKSLENFVSSQNNLYYIYRKVLRILKDKYCIKLSSNSAQKKFSELEVERLKYLQPICETFIQSLEQVLYVYHQNSLYLIGLYPNLNLNHLITKFDAHDFILQGEVTYERLKKFYYMYVLVQSELMLLLATLYKHNSVNDYVCFHRQLSQVTGHLSKILKRYYCKLNTIIEDYKSSKIGRFSIESQKKRHVKWQEFYVHFDLLARKIQSAYNNICSITDELDNWNDSEEIDEFFGKLTEKMETICQEINTARNFAEFNILLINKYKNPRQLNYSQCNEKLIINHNKNELPVIFDEDPFVVDEVFEEYIKEEYFKPLYEDQNSESLDKIKLDKLLAKNFMIELKEALLDKYLSMSEREAQALLRFKDKYLVEKKNNDKVSVKPQTIPDPPSLPKSKYNINFYQNQDVCEPLPRVKKFQTYSESTVIDNILKPHDANKCILNANLLEQQEITARLPISINVHNIQLPAFLGLEETFTGSGENSDEELIQSDS